MSTTIAFDLCQEWGIRWATSLFHFLWQGTLISGVALFVLITLKSSEPAKRYRVLVSALVAMILSPLATFCLLSFSSSERSPERLETIPTASLNQNRDLDQSTTRELPAGNYSNPTAMTSVSNQTGDVQRGRIDSVDGTRRTFALGLVFLYGVVVSVLLMRTAIGYRQGRLLSREKVLIESRTVLDRLNRETKRFGLLTAPLLAYSRHIAVPTVVGILRPVILMPISYATNHSLDDLQLIIAHELAHIKRHDLAVNLMQRFVEAFLFFHPAVWIISRAMRIEREKCCDDMVLNSGVSEQSYVKVLLRVAENCVQGQSGSGAMISLHAVDNPSELRIRISRLLGDQSLDRHLRTRSNRLWVFSSAAVLLMATVMISGVATSEAQLNSQLPDWGAPSNGLQMRAMAVASDMDEQNPTTHADELSDSYDSAEQISLVLEIRNVSDKPIQLQGVRYGDSVTPPWPGKSVSSNFAPYLCELRVFDSQGDRVTSPIKTMKETDVMLSLMSGSAESLEPGGITTLLVRPLEWNPSLANKLSQGEYKLELIYKGTPVAVQQEIRKHWPDNSLGQVWQGDLTARGVTVTIRQKRAQPQLEWYENSNGVRVAAEYRLVDRRSENVADFVGRVFPIDSRVGVTYHIHNAGSLKLEFESELSRQQDTVSEILESGESKKHSGPFSTGWPRTVRWTIKPGETALIPAMPMGFKSPTSDVKLFHPIGPTITTSVREITLRHTLDTVGLVTGKTTLRVRDRTPADDPPTFDAVLRFMQPNGRAVNKGFMWVREQISGKKLFEGKFDTELVLVPGFTGRGLTVYVRARGFEETRFYDVKPVDGKPTSLALTPSDPVRLRLVGRDGHPVAGAKVRYFNRSKKLASVGPYPTKLLKGDVLAVSSEDGQVILDSLQRLDPLDKKLGNNIYWFYIEPRELAPLFIGPVEAGADLGDVEVGPFLEVSGEVVGSDEDLKNFWAEWDQPAAIVRGNGKDSWQFAVTKSLEISRQDGKMTFHLKGLRPGTLRFISSFTDPPRGSSYSYSRRDPGPTDKVLLIELRESRHDVVLRNK